MADSTPTTGSSGTSYTDLFKSVLDAGKSIFQTTTQASNTKRETNASITESMASIAKSKYTLITVGLILVGVIIWRMARKR